MLQCPQCTKPLRELVRRCPTCKADLDLLVDYVSHLHGGLERAENLTRSGELGHAVWAYLEVLEVDPDNATARRQVSRVVTAVRQFDYVTPGRRWVDNLPPLPASAPSAGSWLRWALIGIAVLLAFATGVLFGRFPLERPQNNDGPAPSKVDQQQMGS